MYSEPLAEYGLRSPVAGLSVSRYRHVATMWEEMQVGSSYVVRPQVLANSGKLVLMKVR